MEATSPSLSAAPGVYAVYDKSGKLQYVGLSRKIAASVSAHVSDLGGENERHATRIYKQYFTLLRYFLAMRAFDNLCTDLNIAKSPTTHKNKHVYRTPPPSTLCVADTVASVRALPVPEGTKEALQAGWKAWITEYVEASGEVRGRPIG